MGQSTVPAPSLRLGTLDNVRVLRLGNSNAVSLPKNIEPASTYQMMVYPDGSILGDTSWVLRYTGPGESIYQQSNLSISAQGRVSISKPLNPLN